MELLQPLEDSSPHGAWTVHTDVFEGPLDLLLYLVKREGVDLRRLDVRRITDSYLAYLDRMRVLNLSLAGDYLVMAATLVHLKSLELLPRAPTIIEDEEDPKEALARQLRDYARVRESADRLESRDLLGRDVFTRVPQHVQGDDAWEVGVDAFRLLDLFHQMLERAEAAEAVVDFHGGSGLDFGECCRLVLRSLGGKGGRGDLGQLLGSLPTRAHKVVVFVAVLEMIRQGWLHVKQAGHLAPVQLTQQVDDEAIDLGAITGWVEVEGEA